MEVGKVKIAEDSDFVHLKTLVDDHDGWRLDYDKSDGIKVWTKATPSTNFRMVKLHAFFQDVSPDTMFDVLHDPEYRKDWDTHMLLSIEIGYLNPNNDVGYYALSCPTPIKNRDFVLQRSWLDLGNEKYIFNHSIEHKDYPPQKGFIRGVSMITGFVIRNRPGGCFLGYITQSDPRGKLPSWLVNMITQKFAPKVIRQMYKAALGYEAWKNSRKDSKFKPWTYPEQTLLSPRVQIADCIGGFPSATADMEETDDSS